MFKKIIYIFFIVHTFHFQAHSAQTEPLSLVEGPSEAYIVAVNNDGIGDFYVGMKMLELFHPFTKKGTVVYVSGIKEDSPHFEAYIELLQHYHFHFKKPIEGEFDIYHVISYPPQYEFSFSSVKEAPTTEKEQISYSLYAQHREISKGYKETLYIPSLLNFSLGSHNATMRANFLIYGPPSEDNFLEINHYLDKVSPGWDAEGAMLVSGYSPKFNSEQLRQISAQFPGKKLHFVILGSGEDLEPSDDNSLLKVYQEKEFLPGSVVNTLEALSEVALVSGDTSLMKSLTRGSFPVIKYTGLKFQSL